MNPFTLLVNFLGQTLAFFFSIVPNYGISIILLTLVVSLLLFPLTLKQTRSMKAMQEIQPEVKRLQKEYKENREEMQKHLMALYQERGVNPAAGCLPLLLQMPIWFALFSVLRVGVENGALTGTAIPANSALADALIADNTHFLGMDLLISPSGAASSGIVQAIPYIILVLVVVAAGFYQQVQTTRRNAKRSPATRTTSGYADGAQDHAGVLRFHLMGLPHRSRRLFRHIEPVQDCAAVGDPEARQGQGRR